MVKTMALFLSSLPTVTLKAPNFKIEGQPLILKLANHILSWLSFKAVIVLVLMYIK
tara:strand:- start:65 stop:232 length:168 start_codon:yes stop_codon:yes gene_type:complete